MVERSDDYRARKVGAPDAPAQHASPWRRMPRDPKAAASREVIVKVTGRARNPKALGAQLAYLTRKGDLPGLHSTGRVLHGMEDMRDLKAAWMADNAAYALHPSCQTQSVGIVLSMPEGTPRDAVREAAHEWAREHLSPSTEWVAVQHADRRHYHTHVCARAVLTDGYRLTSSPRELQDWRETFARELQERGVMALATPRHELIQLALARRQEMQELPRERVPSVSGPRLSL